MSQHRIVIPRIHFYFARQLVSFGLLLTREAEHVPHDPRGLPWFHPFQLLREARFVGGGEERLLAQNRRRLVLAVPVARRARKPQNNHVGPESPDHPDHVAENLLVSPFLEGFGARLGEAEVDGSRKK